MIREMIKDALKDHLVLTGQEEVDCVYNWSVVPEIKGMLDDAHVTNSVYVYPIPGDAHDEPDMWCAITWMEAGQLNTVGFNWMSQERQSKLEVFNEVNNNPRYWNV